MERESCIVTEVYASIARSRSSLKDKEENISLNKGDELATNKEAITEILGIALPTLFFYDCLYLQQTILLSFVTKMYDEQTQKDVINGVGISNLYMNCTLVSVIVGMVSGFNVLAGNSFGQKRFHLFGIYLHRALICCFMVCISIIIIHIFTAKYGFRLLGAEGESLEYAINYSHISMYFALFEIFFNISYRYLNIAKQGYITIIVLVVTTCLHPLWCWLFIEKLELKIIGGAISIVLSQLLTGLSLFGYILIKKPIEGTIFCFTANSFKQLGSFFKIAMPSALLLCLEWWALELQQIVIINSGRSDWEVQLSSQILSANIFSLLYSTSIGFGLSIIVTTSKYIAQGSIPNFKKSIKIASIMGLITMAVVQSIMYIAKNNIYNFFTDKEEIKDISIPLLPYIFLTALLHNIKGIFQGVLIGMRKQIFSSLVGFASYYPISIGLSVILVDILDLGVKGVWIAMSAGYAFMTILLVIYLLCLDLNKIIEFTQEKLAQDQDALNDINNKNEPLNES